MIPWVRSMRVAEASDGWAALSGGLNADGT